MYKSNMSVTKSSELVATVSKEVHGTLNGMYIISSVCFWGGDG